MSYLDSVQLFRIQAGLANKSRVRIHNTADPDRILTHPFNFFIIFIFFVTKTDAPKNKHSQHDSKVDM
jgi:hypothetical protein